MVLYRAIYAVTWVNSLYIGYLRGPWTLPPVCDRFAVDISIPVLKTLVCPALISHMRGERYNIIKNCIKLLQQNEKKINQKCNIQPVHCK